MKRLLFILLFVLASSLTQAQDQQRDKKAQLEKEIAFLDQQLNANAQKSKNALSSLNLTKKKISTRKKLISENAHDIRVMNDSIYAKQREINRLREREDTLSLYYKKLVINAYKNRDARVWYMYILASENLNQAIKRFSYLRGLSTQMKIQAQKLQDTRAELETQRKALEKMKASALALNKTYKSELEKLNQEGKDTNKLIAELKKNQSKYLKELNEKKKQILALNQEFHKAVSKRSGKPVDVKLTGAFVSNKGKLPWPIDGVIVDSYGEHYHPVFKSVKLPFNNGIGISAKANSPVKAVFDGEVRQIIIMPGYNKCVLIQHGEYFTFYCKLGSVKVKAGDNIRLGQTIGTVDTINGDTQLHFQLWKGKSPQDPALWLR